MKKYSDDYFEKKYKILCKLNKTQQHVLTFFAFLCAYEYEHKIRITDDNREEVIKAFMKEYKKGVVPIMVELGQTIVTHHK